jgi:hypothetical protein
MSTTPNYLTSDAELAEWARLQEARNADPDHSGLFLLERTLLDDPEGSATLEEHGQDYPALRAAARAEAAR